MAAGDISSCITETNTYVVLNKKREGSSYAIGYLYAAAQADRQGKVSFADPRPHHPATPSPPPHH